MLKRVKGSKDLEHSGQLASGTTELIKEGICEGTRQRLAIEMLPHLKTNHQDGNIDSGHYCLDKVEKMEELPVDLHIYYLYSSPLKGVMHCLRRLFNKS